MFDMVNGVTGFVLGTIGGVVNFTIWVAQISLVVYVILKLVKAQESMNVILSAYIAILADRHGAVTIPKSVVSEALGKYRVSAHSDGENYVIEVERNGDRDVKKQL